jgi:hypothetical protein
MKEPVEPQRVRHAVVDEVDLLDRHFERALTARAVELVLTHLALLPAAERELHLAAAAELRIARVEDATEAVRSSRMAKSWSLSRFRRS